MELKVTFPTESPLVVRTNIVCHSLVDCLRILFHNISGLVLTARTKMFVHTVMAGLFFSFYDVCMS